MIIWCRCVLRKQLHLCGLTNTGQVLDEAGDGGEDVKGIVVGTVVGGTTACNIVGYNHPPGDATMHTILQSV